MGFCRPKVIKTVQSNLGPSGDGRLTFFKFVQILLLIHMNALFGTWGKWEKVSEENEKKKWERNDIVHNTKYFYFLLFSLQIKQCQRNA